MSQPRSIEKRVRDVLRRVEGPRGREDLLERDRIRDLRVSGEGEVRFDLELGPDEPADLVAAAREAAASVEGVRTVRVGLRTGTSGADGPADGAGAGASDPPQSTGEEGDPPATDAPSPRERATGRSLPIMGQGGGGDGHGHGEPGDPGGRPDGPRPRAADREAASRHPREAPALPGVDHVVAVSSGKGGVGKSTVATNLAAAWADEGHRVGLLDADVYGPDIPTMFGVHERPRMEGDEVVPLEGHGVRLMSLGFIVDEDTPSIWRGPIIQGIVRQFLEQVRWGELDFLVVDLPPGTGDAQLSLSQLVRLDGGVFVTTPQDVAVGGVLKGVRMFERLEIPVSGIVENMRGFVCPDCGSHHEIFGSGGGEKLAASQGIPFLGAVPLGTAVREEGDRGLPTVLGRPDSPEAKALRHVAAAAMERVVEMAAGREASGDEASDAAGAASAGPTSGGTAGSDPR